MTDPVCPEHGCEMRLELQPLWWRGKCGCPIRVFEETRAGYVPATNVLWTSSLRPDFKIPRPGRTSWHRLAA